MLLMGNLMGRQLRLECLTVEQMFINGQIIRECLGAESGASPQILNGQAKTAYDWSTGYDWL
jgi:hypothetical protein